MLNLDPNESVILEVRKHWYVLASRVFVMFLLVIAPPIFFAFFESLIPASVPLPVGYSAAGFFYSLWLLVIWISFFINWTNYYLDVWYVTEKRIVSVDQVSIFHRKISNLRFDKIQDVSIEIKGAIQTMLKFGDIEIKTAAEGDSNFLMENAANPDEVRRIIFSHHQFEHEKARPVHVVEEEVERPSKDQFIQS